MPPLSIAATRLPGMYMREFHNDDRLLTRRDCEAYDARVPFTRDIDRGFSVEAFHYREIRRAATALGVPVMRVRQALASRFDAHEKSRPKMDCTHWVRPFNWRPLSFSKPSKKNK